MKNHNRIFISILLFLGLSLSVQKANAQSFYDINTIQTIELYFGYSNWDYMMDTAKAGSGSYILADSVRLNGISLDSVGVKYKGNSSYNSSRVKNPLHIELDHYKADHIYDGITDIKLNNGFKDPTLVRETVTYTIARNYMSAPRANYARLYINGQYIGLYTNAESITKKFVFNHFGSKNNTFFKCNPIYTGGNKSNLAYLGADSSLYYNSYEIKSDAGWSDLLLLINTLNNNPTLINNYIDIDRVLWMHALNNLLVNLDSYTGAISQNYYLYKSDNGSFNTVIWDVNESFGCFNNTGTGTLSLTQMQQLSPWLHLNYTERPLIKNLLSVPMYARMYMAHFRTIHNEFFANDEYFSLGNTYQGIIDSSVQADVNKLNTYPEFLNNMTQNVSAGPMSIPGLSLLMNGRKTYLSSQSDMLYSQPTISNISSSDTLPDIGDNIYITASISNGSSVYLGFRYFLRDRFIRIQMYDDGNHGDGAAGDGVFGAQLPVNSSMIQYYIYAENANSGRFSPERAEYEYHTLYSVSGDILAGEVVINEIMAINTSTITDPNGQYDDWIELYNNTNRHISMNGVFLSDSYSTPYKWQFPDNVIIQPGGYLIIWADNDLNQSGLHANFKLSGTGENVVLSYNTGYYIDDISFGVQTADVSYGRYPNGTGGFTFLTPTPLAFNQPLSVEELSPHGNIKLYPNPFTSIITIQSTNENIEQMSIYDIKGMLMLQSINLHSKDLRYDLTELPAGVYTLTINNKYSFKLIKQ
jgi:hypothetical protein